MTRFAPCQSFSARLSSSVRPRMATNVELIVSIDECDATGPNREFGFCQKAHKVSMDPAALGCSGYTTGLDCGDSHGRYRARTCDLTGVIRALWPTELIARCFEPIGDVGVSQDKRTHRGYFRTRAASRLGDAAIPSKFGWNIPISCGVAVYWDTVRKPPRFLLVAVIV